MPVRCNHKHAALITECTGNCNYTDFAMHLIWTRGCFSHSVLIWCFSVRPIRQTFWFSESVRPRAVRRFRAQFSRPLCVYPVGGSLASPLYKSTHSLTHLHAVSLVEATDDVRQRDDVPSRAGCSANHHAVAWCRCSPTTVRALMLLVGRPVKTEWWGAGVVVCLERCADFHMAQLMPLPLTVFCFSKIQIGFAFLVPAHLGSPG